VSQQVSTDKATKEESDEDRLSNGRMENGASSTSALDGNHADCLLWVGRRHVSEQAQWQII
jgi:hypothetical protein